MNIKGAERLVRGCVLFAVADTLAAHSMGGFKVGVGFSLRKCRACLATGEQISQKVNSITCTTIIQIRHYNYIVQSKSIHCENRGST